MTNKIKCPVCRKMLESKIYKVTFRVSMSGGINYITEEEYITQTQIDENLKKSGYDYVNSQIEFREVNNIIKSIITKYEVGNDNKIKCPVCKEIEGMKITNEACVPWGSESHTESFTNGFKYAKQKAQSIITKYNDTDNKKESE